MDFRQSDNWKEAGWLNEFASSTRIAKDLTSIYADDVLQAVEENEFNTLSAAIEDLSLRVGLTKEDQNSIFRAASLKKDPKLFVAADNIRNFGMDDLGRVISAYYNEKLSRVTKSAVEELGINNLVDKFASLYAEAAGVDGAKLKEIMKEKGCSAAEAMKCYHDEMKSEKKDDDKEANASSKSNVKTADFKENFKDLSEGKPEWEMKFFDQYAPDEKDSQLNFKENFKDLSEGKPEGEMKFFDQYAPDEKDSQLNRRFADEEAVQAFDDIMLSGQLDQRNLKGLFISTLKYLDTITAEDLRSLENVLKSVDPSLAGAHDEAAHKWVVDRKRRDFVGASGKSKTVTASDAEMDAENEDAADSGAQELEVDGEEGLDATAATYCKTKKTPKPKKKATKKKKGAKKSMNKKNRKAEWEEFFQKKGWFQGSDEPTVEGDITSNNPEKLGYPGEVGYSRKPMAVPVGEDSRPWEQDWFEGAADETKKVMGPKGKELTQKKELQRAKWKAFFEKKAKGQK